MALHWNATKIKAREGERWFHEHWEWIHAFIWVSLTLEMDMNSNQTSTIKSDEDMAAEFLFRLHMVEHLKFWGRGFDVESGKETTDDELAEIVYRCRGLGTNVGFTTRAKWKQRFWDFNRDRADRKIRQYDPSAWTPDPQPLTEEQQAEIDAKAE